MRENWQSNLIYDQTYSQVIKMRFTVRFCLYDGFILSPENDDITAIRTLQGRYPSQSDSDKKNLRTSVWNLKFRIL